MKTYIILMYTTEVSNGLSKEKLEEKIKNDRIKIDKPIIKMLEKPSILMMVPRPEQT